MSAANGTRLSRRALLLGGLASGGLLLEPASTRASERGKPPVLVCVFLRGAVDGLSVLVPYTDDEYYRVRPSIAIPAPGRRGGAIDLDGRFGLHPSLEPLKAAYDAQELALVHAAGSPHPTRSHFEAQDYMESGVVGQRAVTQGWLGRCLAARAAAPEVALRAVALTSRRPLALGGLQEALVVPDLRSFRLRASTELEPVLKLGFEQLYRPDSAVLAERVGGQALSTSSRVRRALRTNAIPLASYPRQGRDFSDVARLIKADVGLEAAWLELGGWDTHRGQGDAQGGELARRLQVLGQALATFRADLGAELERVVVLVMSEFGRTVRENGTGGTDHGHGSVMLALGGAVKGGRVLGTFPGLSVDELHEGRDLRVTTDFREVLAEVCRHHLGVSDPSPLFPAYALGQAPPPGLFG